MASRCVVWRRKPVAVGAYIVRPGKSRHGPLPRWGKREYAQAAIGALYPNGGVPENVSDLSLCAKVNVWLLAVPDYCGKYEDKKSLTSDGGARTAEIPCRQQLSYFGQLFFTLDSWFLHLDS